MKALAIVALVICAATSTASSARAESLGSQYSRIMAAETIYNPTPNGSEANDAPGTLLPVVQRD